MEVVEITDLLTGTLWLFGWSNAAGGDRFGAGYATQGIGFG
jgi:hypothetical protein